MNTNIVDTVQVRYRLNMSHAGLQILSYGNTLDSIHFTINNHKNILNMFHSAFAGYPVN